MAILSFSTPLLVVGRSTYGYQFALIFSKVRGLFRLEDTWLKKKGGNTDGAPKKDFGTIPYFLVIADYEKAFLYAALK